MTSDLITYPSTGRLVGPASTQRPWIVTECAVRRPRIHMGIFQRNGWICQHNRCLAQMQWFRPLSLRDPFLAPRETPGKTIIRTNTFITPNVNSPHMG